MRNVTRRLVLLLAALLLVMGRHRADPGPDPEDRDECEGEDQAPAGPAGPVEHRGADASWSPLAEMAAGLDGLALTQTHREARQEAAELHAACVAISAAFDAGVDEIVAAAMARLDLDPAGELSVLGLGATREWPLVLAGAR